MAKKKGHSPVVEQVLNAYEQALKDSDWESEDSRRRLIEVMLGAAAPTAKRIEEALFPLNVEEDQ